MNEKRRGIRRVPIFLLAVAALGAALAEAYVFVVVDKASVQETPAYFAKKIADVREGDKLQLLKVENGWATVRLDDGRNGFIRETAIVTKEKNRDWSKLLGRPDSARDTYAAGKGFGPEVESQYKKDSHLDYGPVDRMIARPSYPNPLDQLRGFREEGHLGEFAGGR